MTAVAITAELLTLNTRSADYPHADGGGTNGLGATTAADGFVVSPPSGYSFDERTIFKCAATTAAVFVFKAGDRFPAHRVDLGDLSITVATNDGRFVAIETSRFLQNDGTILVTCTNATTDVLTCLVLPKAG